MTHPNPFDCRPTETRTPGFGRVQARAGREPKPFRGAGNRDPVNASHHVLALKKAGLVTGRKDNRFVRYTLVGAAATAARLELAHASGPIVAVPLE
jgi:hypothetical protein